MIFKPYKQGMIHKDRQQRAGAAAESQMAHYLNRAFRDDKKVFVLHGLRLEDRDQPEQDGSSGLCQIDHLVVHRRGLFIIESKSVTDEVRIRSDGSGGDEWTRVWRGKETGMPSPIRQAKRQSDFLRAVLNRHAEELLGKQPLGLRTVIKLVAKTDQRGFTHAPIQLVVAVSDKGKIKRIGGWTEPREPFRTFVAKADLVPDKINHEINAHHKGRTMARSAGDYGLWAMKDAESARVAKFLATQHTDRPSAPSTPTDRNAPNQNRNRRRSQAVSAGGSAKAVCKHCSSTDLTPRRGPYSYYWKCGECDENTTMSLVCSACGPKGTENKEVRIRQDKNSYFRDCHKCGESEPIWA